MVDRIVIAEIYGKNKVFGDLRKCKICNVNFSAKGNCILCDMRIEKEGKLGRELTKEEWKKEIEWLL